MLIRRIIPRGFHSAGWQPGIPQKPQTTPVQMKNKFTVGVGGLTAVLLCSCVLSQRDLKDKSSPGAVTVQPSATGTYKLPNASVGALLSGGGQLNISYVPSGGRGDINIASMQDGVFNVLTKPEDQIVATNGSVTFFTAVEPAQTNDVLTYQWRKNDVDISAANSPSLVLTNVQVADVGFYSCRIGIQGKGATTLVRGQDCDAPGARLFVYTGTATAINGPYQKGAGTKSCIGSYKGSVVFKDEISGTYLFSRPEGKTQCKITDTTISGVPADYSAKVQYVDSFNGYPNCATHALGWFGVSAPPTHKYQFSTWVTSGELTNGFILTLDVSWQ
jgi:hypothetical protein